MTKVLCLDCDGTLWTTAWPNVGVQKPIHKLILNYAKYLQNKGWYVVLNTCREGKSLAEALAWLERKNFIPDNANNNSPSNIETYGDCRKVSGNLIIDDKNIGLLGFYLRFIDKQWSKKHGIS